MATRAFLLCGDEKAVQAVTQILDELEVSFEQSSEPAFSLKRLATQRFDLLIVDCDNAQNATQVFNSARASSLNKTSIAIAIVEGKAGVPNAFRLGASLVLTKPVSLEQTRNTVRTGIGMTRKDTHEVKTAVVTATQPVALPITQNTSPATLAPPATPPVAAIPVAPVRPPAAPVVLTPVAPPVPVTPKPTAEVSKPPLAPTPLQENPAVPAPPTMVPVIPQPPLKPALTSLPGAKDLPTGPGPALTKATAASAKSPATAASKDFDSVFNKPVAGDAKVSSTVPKPDVKGSEASGSSVLSIVDPLAEEDALDPVKDHGVPSFGAMGHETFAGMKEAKSGGRKGLLIAAVVLLIVGGGGYGAWLTQPGFHKFVAWEYLRGMSKIAALRGQPQEVAAKPAPVAPVVAPVTPPDPTPSADMTTASGTASDPAITAGNTSPSPAAQPVNSTPAPEPTTKTAAVQPAKQDTSGNHRANPTLVPASLPATPVAKTPSSELLEVPEDFADDQIIRRVHPTYPNQARARKLHGTVVLEAIVNKKGAVDSLQLVSGDPLLAQAAAAAVKQWKYKPYFHNNEPTDFQTRITIDFKLP